MQDLVFITLYFSLLAVMMWLAAAYSSMLRMPHATVYLTTVDNSDSEPETPYPEDATPATEEDDTD